MQFNEFGLDKLITLTVEEEGYTSATPIQCEAIPEILKGRDLRATAQTGTGKTAAFMLPILHKLLSPPKGKGIGPRVLILAPTRELALQIQGEALKFGKKLKRVQTICIYGGVPYPKQRRELSRFVDILIATPGRLLDFIQQKKIDFSRLETIVLDEADRMLDMGFYEPVVEIVSKTPKERQTLLFSATMSKSVIRLSDSLLKDPLTIEIHTQKQKHENIEQKLHYVDNLDHKNKLLDHILLDDSLKHAIVFTATKRHADQLAQELSDKGHLAAPLHGDMSQRVRTRTIERMKKGLFKILVATDVAARGIDMNSISHVINFDLPSSAEDYVHRIGRTGRAGAKGLALSFAGGRERNLVKQIEIYTGQPLSVSEIEGLKPSMKPQNGLKVHSAKRRSGGAFRGKKKFSRGF